MREVWKREMKKKKKKEEERYFKKNKRRVRPAGGVNGFSPLRLRGTNGNSGKWWNARRKGTSEKGLKRNE